ncbi:MAG: ABC transporter permease [Bacteroides sp.]|nr:ABC transporter permease [Bacteroides sp.]
MTVAEKIENELKYFDFFKGFLKRSVKRRYFKPPLRIAAALVVPLLLMAAAAPLMSLVFPESTDNYAVYFYCGELVFIFLFDSARRSVGAVGRNAAYIRSVGLPKHIFVTSAVTESLVPLILSIVPLLAVMLITGVRLTLALLMLPLLIALMFIFSLGFSLLLAAYGTLIKGFYRIYIAFSAVWLLVTPVFYPLTAVPEKIRFLFDVNPAVHYIDIMRTICLSGIPSERSLIVSTIYAALVFLLGVSVFKSKENKFFLYV